MALRHLQSMTGHSDVLHQSSLLGLDACLQRTIRPHCNVPFGLVNQVVELNQIDVIDPHAHQGRTDLIACSGIGTLASLGGEKEPIPTSVAEPRLDAVFRFAITRCSVNMVNTVLNQQL